MSLLQKKPLTFLCLVPIHFASDAIPFTFTAPLLELYTTAAGQFLSSKLAVGQFRIFWVVHFQEASETRPLPNEAMKPALPPLFLT